MKQHKISVMAIFPSEVVRALLIVPGSICNAKVHEFCLKIA